ncbi:hypothetical protein ACIOV9_07685 [Pseudomonas iridis]|uniref:hypothetical protein n=1 Tax=Pseudomonas iridis TaxID=2710587 RepID=UPI00380B227D
MCEPTPKLLVAVQLLDRALSMYYQEDSYFAALHLAGAAEEIMGVYVERKGHESSFNSLHAVAVKFTELLNDDAGAKPKDIINLMNYARNRTKHIDREGDDNVYFDPKSEAFDILDRAITNFYTLMQYFDLRETENLCRFNAERVAPEA